MRFTSYWHFGLWYWSLSNLYNGAGHNLRLLWLCSRQKWVLRLLDATWDIWGNRKICFSSSRVTLVSIKWWSPALLVVLFKLYSDIAFTVGGYGTDRQNETKHWFHGQTEVLDLNTQKWRIQAAYPFASDIATAPTLYHSSSFLVFGGINSSPHFLSTIARYTPATDKWEKLGNLQTPRSNSAVVTIRSGSFLIIGGESGVDRYYPTYFPDDYVERWV